MDTETARVATVFADPLRARLASLDRSEPEAAMRLVVSGMARFLLGTRDDDEALLHQAAKDCGQALDAGLRDPFLRAAAGSIRFGVLVRFDEEDRSGAQQGKLTQVLLTAWDELAEDLRAWFGTPGAHGPAGGAIPMGSALATIQLARAAETGRGMSTRVERYRYAAEAARVGHSLLTANPDGGDLRLQLSRALYGLDMDTWRSRDEVPSTGATPHEFFLVRHPEKAPTHATDALIKHARESRFHRDVGTFGLREPAHDALVATVHEPTLALLTICFEAWAREDTRAGQLAATVRVGDSVEGPFKPRLSAVAMALRVWAQCERLTEGEHLGVEELEALPQGLVVMVNEGQAWIYLGRPRERAHGVESDAVLPSIWADVVGLGLLAAQRCRKPLSDDWALYLLVVTEFLAEEPNSARHFRPEQLGVVLAQLDDLSQAIAAPRAAAEVRRRLAELRTRTSFREAEKSLREAMSTEARPRSSISPVSSATPVHVSDGGGCGCLVLCALLPLLGTAASWLA